MANWEVCYNWMMDNEDAARQYKTLPDAPPGALVISGINSAAYPQQFNQINAIPQANRAPAVENFYNTEFWNTWFIQLVYDDVAKRVLDTEVNMGQGTGVKILQQALGFTQEYIDGRWGPNTVGATNHYNPVTLVTLFKNCRVQHYEDIITLKPADAKYRTIWETRANK